MLISPSSFAFPLLLFRSNTSKRERRPLTCGKRPATTSNSDPRRIPARGQSGTDWAPAGTSLGRRGVTEAAAKESRKGTRPASSSSRGSRTAAPHAPFCRPPSPTLDSEVRPPGPRKRPRTARSVPCPPSPARQLGCRDRQPHPPRRGP